MWRERKEKIKQELQKQTEENIKELKEMGIDYVSLEEYRQNKDKYNYAIGVLPTYQPTKLEWLRTITMEKAKWIEK